MAQKTIYLANHARDQLETSDDARVWARPIEYREKPEPGFTMELPLHEEDLQYSPLEDGLFHPDRSEPDSICERLAQVDLPKPKRKKVTVKPGDAITMYFHGAGVTSEEEVIVERVGRKYLFIEADEGSPHKFDMKTGKCLDDITDFGFYRTIDKLL